jgi:hypothetical protein
MTTSLTTLMSLVRSLVYILPTFNSVTLPFYRPPSCHRRDTHQCGQLYSPVCVPLSHRPPIINTVSDLAHRCRSTLEDLLSFFRVASETQT